MIPNTDGARRDYMGQVWAYSWSPDSTEPGGEMARRLAEVKMGGPARLRDRQVLKQRIAALTNETRSGVAGEDADFRRGALAALRWVTVGGAGPLTGSLLLPPVRLAVIVKELAAAEAVIYGRPSQYRDYACGVEHALMWAQFATATPPLPPPRPQPGSGPQPPGPAAGSAVEAATATWEHGAS